MRSTPLFLVISLAITTLSLSSCTPQRQEGDQPPGQTQDQNQQQQPADQPPGQAPGETGQSQVDCTGLTPEQCEQRRTEMESQQQQQTDQNMELENR